MAVGAARPGAGGREAGDRREYPGEERGHEEEREVAVDHGGYTGEDLEQGLQDAPGALGRELAEIDGREQADGERHGERDHRGEHGRARQDHDAEVLVGEERRPFGVGQEAPERDLAEERDRLVHRQRAQDPPDDGRSSAVEVALGHDRVRDVAARSAADKDLRARRPGALEDDHAPVARPAPREDRSRQAGGPAAHDRDVGVKGGRHW